MSRYSEKRASTASCALHKYLPGSCRESGTMLLLVQGSLDWFCPEHHSVMEQREGKK